MTRNYTNENDVIKVLVDIYNNLHQIEVKGDSVEYLLTAKVFVKQLMETTKEVKEDSTLPLTK